MKKFLTIIKFTPNKVCKEKKMKIWRKYRQKLLRIQIDKIHFQIIVYRRSDGQRVFCSINLLALYIFTKSIFFYNKQYLFVCFPYFLMTFFLHCKKQEIGNGNDLVFSSFEEKNKVLV